MRSFPASRNPGRRCAGAAVPSFWRDRRARSSPPHRTRSLLKTRTGPEHWLAISADDFKDVLLTQALRDGSYDSHLVPDEVRELEAVGEKFYPRELAALVHNESSILSKKATNEALKKRVPLWDVPERDMDLTNQPALPSTIRTAGPTTHSAPTEQERL